MKLQQLAEEKVGVLIVFTLLVVSVGLLIEAVPLFFSKAVTEPAPGVNHTTPCKWPVVIFTYAKAATTATLK